MNAKMVQKHEKLIYRIFEMLPGILVWGFILSPLWLGVVAPKVVIFYITFLTVFWTFLALRHTYGGFVGYKKYKKELSVDWMEECKNLNFSQLPHKDTLPSSLKETKHFILIPAYNEPRKMFESTIGALVNQTFPLEQVTLVFSFEEKFSDRVTTDVKEILGEDIKKFEEVLFYTHPAGIEGEARGVAGANRTWGATHAVEHLQKRGANLRNYIFTTFDCDSILHEQFLARLTHLYLSSDKRDNKFYSTAVHLFNNNIWQVPTLMRIEANSVTIASLSDWIVTAPALKETFSCYSASLQTLIDANYWDVKLGIDDTIFYWRAFIARSGDFEGREHYIPYSADAVQAENFWASHKSMYLQLRRWGLGAVSIPISMVEFLRNKSIPRSKKLLWTINHLEKRVVLFTLVFLMTFGVSLLTLVNQDARQISLVYTLPNIMSSILTFTLVFLLPISILRSKVVAPMPKEWGFIRKAIVFVTEGPLVIINLLTFSLIPWIDAYTRMLFGKNVVDFYWTPKIRK